MKKLLWSSAWVSVVLALATPGAAADRAWIEAKSPHFTVVSDGSERTARAIAWQLEQVRAAVRTLCPWAHADLNRPVLVFGLKDEDDMKALAPQYWEQKGAAHPSSLAITSTDRYDILLRADVEMPNDQNTNPYLQAYWSYSTILITTGLKRDLPLWYTRGLANVLGNAVVRDSYVEVGRPIPGDVRLMGTQSRIKLRDLITIDRNSPWSSQQDKLPFFDAESWAFVDFLLFGNAGKHRSQMDQLLASLLNGTPAPAAVTAAFPDLEALEQEFVLYLSRGRFETGRLNVDLSVKPEGFVVRPVSSAESNAMRAGVLATMGRTSEAEALLQESRKGDGALAAGYDVEGGLLDRQRKPDEAIIAYAKAIELGSTNFYTHYRWAQLTLAGNPSTESLARAQQSADRAVALNSAFAPALGLSATIKMQLRRPGDAVVTLQRAIALEPAQTQYRVSLARALMALGANDQALVQAREGLAVATSDQERAAAQQVIDALAAAAARAPDAGNASPR